MDGWMASSSLYTIERFEQRGIREGNIYTQCDSATNAHSPALANGVHSHPSSAQPFCCPSVPNPCKVMPVTQAWLSSTPCLQELLGSVGKGRRGPCQPKGRECARCYESHRVKATGRQKGFLVAEALKAGWQDSHLSPLLVLESKLT